MRKICLTSLFVLSGLSAALAQPKYVPKEKKNYIRIGGGYSMPHGTQTDMGGNWMSGNYLYNGNSEKVSLKKVSFGAGTHLDVAIGRMFTENIGLELAVSYMIAPKQYAISFSEISQDYSDTYDQTLSPQRRFIIMPSLVLQAPVGNLKVYSRLGAAVPSGTGIEIKQNGRRDPAGVGTIYDYKSTSEMKTKFGFGAQGALGLMIPMDPWYIWVEANMISMNTWAKSSSMKSFTVNGTDVMDQLTVSERETNYSNDVTVNADDPDYEPSKMPTFAIPYSSIGFSAGLRFRL